MMFKETGDLRVAYEAAGEGPPLVLLHGIGADALSWSEMMPYLSRSFAVSAPDLRGFGRTVRPPLPRLSHDLWADDVRRFIESLGAGRVALAGWSLGGTIALNVAVRYPHLLSHLIIIGAASPRRPLTNRGGFDERLRLAQSGASIETIVEKTFAFTAGSLSPVTTATRPHAVEQTRQLLLRNRPEWYAEAVEANARRPDIGGALGRIDCAALIVVGDADSRNPVEMAEDLNVAIPRSYMKIIPECGHFYGFEQPEVTSRVMLEFLLAFR